MKSMDTVPFVDLVTQYENIRSDVDAAIQEILSRCEFIMGPQVEEFEQQFARFVGCRRGIGVASGADALRLALMALEIGPGDEIIVPANSYIATAFAVTAVGASPVLVDCDPKTYNIDVRLIPGALTPRTRAIIPVHLTGQAADMDSIMSLAHRHGLQVVEDAAQAHGASWNGRPCGAFGRAGCFSFYPSKNLGAFGDGGRLTTSDDKLAVRVRQLRNNGQDVKNHHVEWGFNSRLDTLQAAVLAVKLRYLPRWNASRINAAHKYHELLDGVGDVTFQQIAPGATHVYHLFVVETDYRDRLSEDLHNAGIHTGVHYPTPIHLQPAYAHVGYARGRFPHAERLAQRGLSLPMYPELRDDQIRRVAQAIRRFFTHAARISFRTASIVSASS